MDKRKHIFSLMFLVIGDIIAANLAAYLTLVLRLEMTEEALSDFGFLSVIAKFAVPGTVLVLTMILLFKGYTSMWEYAGYHELTLLIAACTISSAFYMLMVIITNNYLPRSFPIIYALMLSILVIFVRLLYRLVFSGQLTSAKSRLNAKLKRTMIIGAGAAAAMAIREFSTSSNSKNKIVCVIDDDKSKKGNYIRGAKVIGGRDKIISAALKYNVDEIVICIPSAPLHVKQELYELCAQTGVKVKSLPTLAQLTNGEVSVSTIKEVSIDDLLGRTQVISDTSVISGRIKDNVVLVTGGGGSIGSELCRQIASFDPERLIIFDIYENNAYDIQMELKRNYPSLNLEVLIGSVRDVDRVRSVFNKYRPDVVYHAAAHKHVPLMEDSPAEAIKNNVFGTYNVAKAATEFETKLFVLVSTDKAVRPTNVMGASKRVCEMIAQSFNRGGKTKYIAVRFGNVLGSNGSVIPLFKKQIAEGGPVTVTDKRVTRFFMTIPEAVSLILQASAFAEGGEVFVLDMGKPVRIDEVARKMIRLSGFEPDVDIKIEYVGLRPGEKLYEELLLKSEGLQKTDNELIYIGHQKIYSPEEINEKLDALRSVIPESNRAVRNCILSIIDEPIDTSYSDIPVEKTPVSVS